MTGFIKVENEKIAAIDFATATETVADEVKRAKIKEAEAIKLINEAADKYFIGNAQL